MEPTDRDALIAAVRGGRSFRYRFFWGHRARPEAGLDESCFSQWWRSDFDVDGDRYSSAEQFMMAGKARLFGDEEMRTRILAEDDPSTIKGLGRKVRGFDGPTWDRHGFDIVVAGNVAKFGQNPRLASFLLSTGHDVLVEASPMDVVWGIGATRDDPVARHPEQWRGQNLLGFALMRARQAVRAGLAPDRSD